MMTSWVGGSRSYFCVVAWGSMFPRLEVVGVRAVDPARKSRHHHHHRERDLHSNTTEPTTEREGQRLKENKTKGDFKGTTSDLRFAMLRTRSGLFLRLRLYVAAGAIVQGARPRRQAVPRL